MKLKKSNIILGLLCVFLFAGELFVYLSSNELVVYGQQNISGNAALIGLLVFGLLAIFGIYLIITGIKQKRNR